MDKETKDIIKLIAGIQIESLSSLKEDMKANKPFDEGLRCV